jgi:TRAP-type transport system periplasmic protein
MKKRIVLSTALGFFTILIALGTLAYAQEKQSIELKYAHWLPPNFCLHTEVWIPWVKEVEEKTNGRVKIRIYPAEALGKVKDMADMVVNNVCDIGIPMPHYTPGRFPMTSILELPLVSPSAYASTMAYYDLVQKYFAKEYVGFKFLFGESLDSYHFMTNKPVKRLDDLQGLKLRAAAAAHVTFIKSLGAAPVTVPGNEAWDATRRGIVDGNFMPMTSFIDFKLSEVTKFLTYAGVKGMEGMVIMNQKVWDSLPKDVQGVFQQLNKKYAELSGRTFDAYALKAKDVGIKAGIEFVTLPAEDMKKMRSFLQPQYDEKVAAMEAKGLPGKQLLADTIQLLEKYGK